MYMRCGQLYGERHKEEKEENFFNLFLMGKGENF